MRVLVCCEELPFPPRNGVTIPIAGYIELLRTAGHDVECLVLHDKSTELPDGFLDINRNSVSRLHIVYRTRFSKVRRLFDEATGKRPSFLSWNYGESHQMTLHTLHLDQFDALIASPIGALDVALSAKASHQVLVAAISETYTSVLAHQLSVCKGPSLRCALLWLRVLRMKDMERRLLSSCSSVIVQTPSDLEWLSRIGGEGLLKRGFAIRNGVNQELLQMDSHIQAPSTKDVLFVANFKDPHYLERLRWLYTDVWPLVVNSESSARLRIVGRGIDRDPNLKKALAEDESVVLTDFLPSIVDVYRSTRVTVAPIFKTFGYINKVGESLAAGIPIVGDKSAFNGFTSIDNCRATLVAERPEEFADGLVGFLQNDEAWIAASSQAKEYAVANLSWASRKDLFLSTLGECSWRCTR